MVVPAPRPDDEENVAWALITSASLLKGGDLVESLPWLRRAAGSASEAGHDARAVDLFRAAAELADHLPRDSHHDLREGLPPIGLRSEATIQDVVVHTTDAIAPTVPGNVLGVGVGYTLPIRQQPADNEKTLVPMTKRAAEPSVKDTLEVPDTTRPPLQALSSQLVAAPSQPASVPFGQDDTTMASMSSFRVAVLAGADGAPRIMRLASDAEVPLGAAKAVLVAAGADDARMIASLLGTRR
jgi:hypothetical protein